MLEETAKTGWSALLRPGWLPAVAVLVGGVLLHSMNVLMLATVLPSVVDDLGGAALMSWTSTAFLASSIVAATCTGYLTAILGARSVFCAGALIFGRARSPARWRRRWSRSSPAASCRASAAACCPPMAYVLVRSTFPEACGRAAFALLSGAWSMSILVGPLVGGVFARYGDWRGAFFLVTAIACVLAVVACGALPRSPERRSARRAGPARVADLRRHRRHVGDGRCPGSRWRRPACSPAPSRRWC